MTQEQKDLLLKDLCARLPYGVKVSKVVEDYISEPRPIRSINLNNIIVEDGEFEDGTPDIDVWAYEDFKPYLFPLSSMTEEQKKDIFYNGKFYIDRHNSLCRFPMYEDDYDFVTMEDCLEIFNKLNKYHFDYRGLIPMGLAIDATGKNIY